MADPYRSTYTYGTGSGARTLGVSVIPAQDPAAALAERQDRAFAQALGGTFRQLGIERPHAEGSGYLRPDQIAALIALRGGADAGAVLGGASAPSPAGGFSFATLFSTPFGAWPTTWKLGAGVAVLGAVALIAGAVRP